MVWWWGQVVGLLDQLLLVCVWGWGVYGCVMVKEHGGQPGNGKLSVGQRDALVVELLDGGHVASLAVSFGVSVQYCYSLRRRERVKVGWLPQALSESYCQGPGCKKRISNRRVEQGSSTCCQKCANRLRTRREAPRKAAKGKAERARRVALELPLGVAVTARRGDTFRRIKARPDWVVLLLDGGVTHAYIAEQLGVSEASVSRSVASLREEAALSEAKASWEPSRFVSAMLPVGKLERVRELGPGGVGGAEFECLVDELVRAYAVFSRRFFLLEGKRPLVEEFHARWIRSILVAFATGGKQLILSPPRHGKSELLIRFTVWLISMFPNIRIMWVAANSDVAKLMLGAVKDHLTNNEDLIRAVLPPGDTFRPPRDSGKPWSAKEIKVAQQDHVGQKSSSMLALGRTSKILSRDVDILFVDDLEDFDTTREAAQREYSRNKFAEIGTRKEERTAWINIGSRQHPDDIPQQLMKMAHKDQSWNIIEDTAHADCQLDPEEIEGHDENGCVLFPAVRSYRWLMEKKTEMDALGIPGAYEMRYLNQPIPETGIVFHLDVIREKALNRSRGLGMEMLGSGRLIAGIDPASRGTQAAYAWHYTSQALSMVDLEIDEGGGFAGAHKLIHDWYHRYGIADWRYEDNSQQVEFFRDPRTKKLERDLGIIIRPVNTQSGNKHDPELGISSMAPWYEDGTIDLPYGTAEARKKVNMLLRQLELWTTDGVKRGKGRKTDIKMASWFPFPDIVKWGLEDRSVSLQSGYEASYPGINRFQSVPWADTAYPGGR